ncbi:MAG: hypothetical protein U1D55_07430 [Phycisphaerae bacterium]
MTQTAYAERKIRFATTSADSKATEWRALGSLTINGPGFQAPITLRGPYVATLHEAGDPGELRQAEVRFLESLQCRCWEKVLGRRRSSTGCWRRLASVPFWAAP